MSYVSSTMDDIRQSLLSTSQHVQPSSTEPDPLAIERTRASPQAGRCYSWCKAGVPANVSRDAKRTRIAALCIVIIYTCFAVLEALVFNLLNVMLWIDLATLGMAVFARQRLRWSYSRPSHTLAGVLFAMGSALGMIQVAFGISAVLQVRYDYRKDGGIEYYEEYPTMITWVITIFYIVPRAIGGIAFFVGSVFAFKAARGSREREISTNIGEGGPAQDALPV